jgi:Gpi18-like mannosyltransferase
MNSGNNNNNAAGYNPHLAALNQTPIAYRYWLQVYMIAVIFGNFGLLFWDSNGSDTGFWEDWVKQLITKGYSEFNGNYPPIYIHWLYLVGKVYSFLQTPVENNILLKYLTQLPIVFSHMALTGIVFHLVKKYRASSVHFHSALLITALNPAILFNGAIWGQIDVVPVVPVALALLAGLSDRYKLWAFPLYTLGLLTKFQMIAFAPAFGILFFSDIKTHLKSVVICAAAILVAFLPSIVTHNFFPAFKLAYIDVLHQYGATTMGASNIWILLTGNAAPDSIILFGVDNNTLLAPLFTAKHFGMISFTCVCLVIFIQGISNLLKKKYADNNEQFSKDILFYAMLSATAFFTLLPAMHERYLLPAVILALVYFAATPGKIIYPLAFTFISAFNLAMCMGLKTSSVWPAISWIMMAAFFYGIMELLFKRSWNIFIKDITQKLCAFNGLYISVLIISGLTLGNYLVETTKINHLEIVKNQIILSHLAPIHARQDYGTLGINKSLNGTVLTLAGKRFADGLGTHANSQIDYAIPPNAYEFSFIAGLDDEVESASVKFSVWGDGKLIWESAPFYGAEKNLTPITLNIENVKVLSLRVSGLDDISSDHADWVQPIVSLRE